MYKNSFVGLISEDIENLGYAITWEYTGSCNRDRKKIIK